MNLTTEDGRDSSTPVITTPAPVAAEHRIRFGSQSIPVIGPSIHDPRLRLSVIVIALQILGQTVLGFKLSIAQILVTVVSCAMAEAIMTLVKLRKLEWPASGMLTGNSVAFILRASGTKHGDWWSLQGIQYFLFAVALSLLVKYLLRLDGRHLFNPSNVGIVWTLLLLGPAKVFPQYLWWGPLRGPVIAAYAVILFGAVWILKPVRMYSMVLAFLATLALGVSLFALAGRNFSAIWHAGPVSRGSYFFDIVLSPELLVFVFFMMSDPKTTPSTTRGRITFAILTAAVASALIWFQPTEFGIKLAILASLTLTCALARVLDAVAKRGMRGLWQSTRQPRTAFGRLRRPGRTVLNPVLAAITIIALAAPIDTATLANNTQLILIERGRSGSHNPQ